MSDLAFAAGDAPRGSKDATAEHAGDPLPHYVSAAPFDPYAVERMTPAQERFYMASQWRMMWWKFRRHRVAVLSGAILLTMYLSILVCEFLAPYDLDTRNTDFIYAPPQRVHIFYEGRLVAPFVYGYDYRLDMTNLERVYTPNPERRETIRFFCHGDEYLFWGLFRGDLHLACPARGGQLFLLGTDRLGRDMLVPDDLWRADLADGRAPWRLRQLYAGHLDRRHRRLLRRLDRHPDPTRHRGYPILPASAAVDGAVGDPAGELEPDPRLFRHHADPRDDRMDPPRPRRALQAARRCARRISAPPRC